MIARAEILSLAVRFDVHAVDGSVPSFSMAIQNLSRNLKSDIIKLQNRNFVLKWGPYS